MIGVFEETTSIKDWPQYLVWSTRPSLRRRLWLRMTKIVSWTHPGYGNTVMAHSKSSHVLGQIRHKHLRDGVKYERVTRSMSYSRLPLSYILWLKTLMAISQDDCNAVMNKHACRWFDSANLECGGS